ncbi:Na+/H+ antiporter NhaA [Granulicoccus sp. GXG6511]|uniref:Na+/H+ antiporter NhaA n=1 Tax=Granulicoccus sp. GXG6511 TaxID=3381351 RepID=UPI003D7ED680
MPVQSPRGPRPPGESRVFRLTADDLRVLPNFLRRETVGGALMLLATILALTWANLGPEIYEGLRQTHIGPLTVQHWATDGLLTIFFFVAGMELKREFVSGSLADPKAALVPVVAALCGMAVPAGIYVAVNLAMADGHMSGWAIPMATDIAFALAILAAVGSKLPVALRAFLLTLAIVDDLGAILVIAVVFTSDLSLAWLGGALLCALVWWILQRKQIDHWFLYVPLFVVTWWCMLSSGVHATIAGVLLGLLSRSVAADPEDPVDRWSHFWHPVSAGFVVPIFALMAAGVRVTPDALVDMITSPVGLGIVLGLVAGKILGVWGGAYLTTRFTRAKLAPEVRWSEVFAVSILAGVGFTVALFVTELAFPGHPELLEQGKAAVLTASVIAAVLAAIALRGRIRARERRVAGID